MIFICHTPLVWELADHILSVGNGKVVANNTSVQLLLEDAAENALSIAQ